MANTLFLSLDPGGIANESVERRARIQTAILDSNADAIIVGDDTGIVYANRAAKRLLGPAFLASFKVSLADGKACPEDRLPMNRALRGEPFDNEELCLKRIGAPDLWVSSSGRVLVDEGVPRGGVVTFRDITERKAIERRLLLADRMVALGMLAAGVAHEMNTPLSVMVGSLDLALEALESDAAPAEKLRRLVSRARESGRRVEGIIADLRTLSSGSDVTGDVQLARVVESALAIAEKTLQDRAKVVRRIAAVPAIIGSEPKLVQVVLNLLVNAAQAIPAGERGQNEVRVSLQLEGKNVILEVEDTGTGIPPAFLSRVFDPFVTTKAVGEGTGLGLSITQGIVLSVGGDISVTSVPGRTTFRVSFPVPQKL